MKFTQMITLILITFSNAKILQEEKPSNRRVLITPLLGVGSFLLGYLTGSVKWSGQDSDYCEFIKETYTKKQSKEFEIIQIFQRTYVKDLQNKCKVVFRKQYKPFQEEYKKMARLCNNFAQFTQQRLPHTIKFYQPEFALGSFQNVLSHFYFNEENLLNDLQVSQEELQHFFLNMKQTLETQQENQNPGYLDFATIRLFYSQKHLEMMNDIMPKGKLTRSIQYLSLQDQMIQDEAFDVDPNVASAEILRIKKQEDVKSPSNGFEEDDYRTILRYYKEGFDTPFYPKANELLKYVE